MNLTILSIIVAIILSFIGVVGNYFIKISGQQKSWMDIRLFIVGFLVYASTAFGWFFVMKHIKLSTLGVVYSVSTVLFLTLLSVLVFNEKINIYEIIGVMFAIISIVILGKFA